MASTPPTTRARARRRVAAPLAVLASLALTSTALPAAAADTTAPTYRVVTFKAPKGLGPVALDVLGVTESGLSLVTAQSTAGATRYWLLVVDARGRVLFTSDPQTTDYSAPDSIALTAINDAEISDSGTVAMAFHGKLYRWTQAAGLQLIGPEGGYSQVEVNNAGQILSGNRLFAAGATAPVTLTDHGTPLWVTTDLDDAGRVAYFGPGYASVGVWDPVGGAHTYPSPGSDTRFASAVLDGAGQVVATADTSTPSDDPWNSSTSTTVFVLTSAAAKVAAWRFPEETGFHDGSLSVVKARNGRVVISRGDAYQSWWLFDASGTKLGVGSYADPVALDAAGRLTLSTSPKGTLRLLDGTAYEAIPLSVTRDATEAGFGAGWPTGSPYGTAGLAVRTDTVTTSTVPSLDASAGVYGVGDPKATTLRVGGGLVGLMRLPVPAKTGRTPIAALVRLHVTSVGSPTPAGYDVRLVTGPWTPTSTSAPTLGKTLATVAAGTPGGDLAITLDPADLTPGTPLHLALVPRAGTTGTVAFASAQAPVLSQRPRLTVTFG